MGLFLTIPSFLLTPVDGYALLMKTYLTMETEPIKPLTAVAFSLPLPK